MSRFSTASRSLGVLVLTLVSACPLIAAPASQDILPQSTVLWFSLPDAPRFQQKFGQTQIGMLAEDESLAPFCEHLRQQAMKRFGNLQASLGVSLDDVLAATGGEFAIGVAYQEGRQAATIVTIDPDGKQAEAEDLKKQVEAEMVKRKAKQAAEVLSGVTTTVYRLPEQPESRVTRQEVVQFETGGLLCFVEGRGQAKQVIARLQGAGGATLTRRPEFAKTMARCAKESTDKPEVRWFIDPFEYDLARRSRDAKPVLAEREDTITLLRKQGFDAIRGVGGHIQVAVDPRKDFVHRTAVYAPPKPGTEGRPAAEKYELGMRMAETPNRRDLDVENWAPRSTANYSTYSLDVDNAFNHLETVFDAMSGFKGAFKNTLKGFEKDHYGPKIKVREQIIANLGDRITRMADYELPITTDCERFLFVIDAKNPKALKVPIDKWMDNDGAELRELRGVKYWEIVPEEETETNLALDSGLSPLLDDEPSEPEEESLLRRAAVCVHNGKLIIASDVEYLEQAVFGVRPENSLTGSYDFQAVMRELNALVSDPSRCSWSFNRSDESIRPTYELLRQGKLPEGQTFFARLLNKLLTTAEDEKKGIVRRQRIDAHKLPSFELARRYFGPTARAAKAEEDGWFITGVVLNKEGE